MSVTGSSYRQAPKLAIERTDMTSRENVKVSCGYCGKRGELGVDVLEKRDIGYACDGCYNAVRARRETDGRLERRTFLR